MKFFCVLVFSWVFVAGFLNGCAGRNDLRSNQQVFYVPLDGVGKIKLYWTLDYYAEKITFEVHLLSNFGWFALGFSERGELFPADYCLLWYDWKKNEHFQDTWSDQRGVIRLDNNQNCANFKIKRTNKQTKYTFERDFDTCDNDDYIIEDGTTHVVWSKGGHSIYKADGLNVSTPPGENGMVRVTLLKNLNTVDTLPSHTTTLDVLTNKVRIPAEETTYWCHVHKLPPRFSQKHHVYQYESSVENEGVVHHMEVFHCIAPPDKDIPLYVGSCFAAERPESTQACKRVLAAWAMGATAFTYPEEAGLPIGGKDFNPYIMLEVHYNNPEKREGIVDSSGIRFHISSILKQMDAGVLELGLEYTDKMAIPPKQPSFSLSSYCVTECTAVSLPPEGITVFGSQLHTHLSGIRVYTRHVRDGYELRELDRDNHFSTHFQEIRRLKKPVTILPGDALVTTCYYKTVERENVTLGGFAISDEMCVNYIHYYPLTTLEVCKSAISDQGLQTFFRYMKDWENQNTSSSKGISANYQSIEWNPMRVQLLHEVYGESPLSMQCNMSSGDRFPGYWENTPLTPVLMPLPPKTRKCANQIA